MKTQRPLDKRILTFIKQSGRIALNVDGEIKWSNLGVDTYEIANRFNEHGNRLNKALDGLVTQGLLHREVFGDRFKRGRPLYAYYPEPWTAEKRELRAEWGNLIWKDVTDRIAGHLVAEKVKEKIQTVNDVEHFLNAT